MNGTDINRIFLKAAGLVLLLLSAYAAAKALGAIASYAYWTITQTPRSADSFEWFTRQLAMSLIANILQALVLWWMGLQVLKEKPWILKLARINLVPLDQQDEPTTEG